MNFKIAILATVLAVSGATGARCDTPTPEPARAEPSFIDLKEMTLAGIAVFDTPMSGQFPELWRSFPGAVDDSPGLEFGKYAYGLELFPPSFKDNRKFTYMACCAVSDSRKVPLHLVMRTVPAAKYAAFAVPGGLKGLGDTFGYIYDKWLPASKYERAFPFDMERYDVSKEMAEMSIEILVPVKEKEKEKE